jgi:hypothetical protein
MRAPCKALRYGFYAHATAMELARDERARLHLGASPPSQSTLSGSVLCKDGSERPFDLNYVLELMRFRPCPPGRDGQGLLCQFLDRVGRPAGRRRLLRPCPYPGDGPSLAEWRGTWESVHHSQSCRTRDLTLAHATRCLPRRRNLRDHPALDGSPVLFEFMGLGDVLDLLISVARTSGDWTGSTPAAPRRRTSTRIRVIARVLAHAARRTAG